MREKVKISLLQEVQYIEVKGITYKISVEKITDDFCICGCNRQRINKSKYHSDSCKAKVYRWNKKKREEN